MPQKYLRFITLLAGMAMTSAANAQMVDCDIFLKGNHLEIGINSNGAFGTSVEAPVGYHANVIDTMYNDCTFMSDEVFQDLGFVADPNRTNWSSYYGDFIMPNNPREGWAIADNSDSSTAYSYNYYTGSSGFTGTLTGANISYSTSGSQIMGNWLGTFHSTMQIRQTTTIDTGNLYLMVHVGFYNTGSVPDSFYYLRFINPHNEAVTTTSLNTKAKIEHQLPNTSGLVVVSASGIADTLSYIAMGTRDPRAKCFIIKDSTLPGQSSFAALWAGDPVHYNYTDTLTGDHGIGIIYKIGVGAGDSSYLDYGYSFKGGIIDTVLDTSLSGGGGGGGGGTLHVKNTTLSQISIYPNPVNDVVNIAGMSEGNNVNIYDISGRLVNVYPAAGTKELKTINIASLFPGIYMIVIRDENNNIVGKMPISKN